MWPHMIYNIYCNIVLYYIIYISIWIQLRQTEPTRDEGPWRREATGGPYPKVREFVGGVACRTPWAGVTEKEATDKVRSLARVIKNFQAWPVSARVARVDRQVENIKDEWWGVQPLSSASV